MGSEEHLKRELCSGKGLEMLYFTNEIMKQRVSGLGEEHRKLYKFFSDYYRELNTAPLIEDMVLEMRASSKEKVYSLLSDLAAAGCLTAWDGEKRMRPSLSPEEAVLAVGLAFFTEVYEFCVRRLLMEEDKEERTALKKHRVKKIKGIKVVTKVQGRTDRAITPRPAVFNMKTKYDRGREKRQIWKEIDEQY